MGPPWRIDPTTHRIMSEHSYNRATSCSPWNMDATFPSVLYCMDSATSHSASLTKEVLYTIDNSPLMYYTDQTITQATDSYGDQHNIHLTLPPPPTRQTPVISWRTAPYPASTVDDFGHWQWLIWWAAYYTLDTPPTHPLQNTSGISWRTAPYPASTVETLVTDGDSCGEQHNIHLTLHPPTLQNPPPVISWRTAPYPASTVDETLVTDGDSGGRVLRRVFRRVAGRSPLPRTGLDTSLAPLLRMLITCNQTNATYSGVCVYIYVTVNV